MNIRYRCRLRRSLSKLRRRSNPSYGRCPTPLPPRDWTMMLSRRRFERGDEVHVWLWQITVLVVFWIVPRRRCTAAVRSNPQVLPFASSPSTPCCTTNRGGNDDSSQLMQSTLPKIYRAVSRDRNSPRTETIRHMSSKGPTFGAMAIRMPTTTDLLVCISWSG